MTKPFRSRFPNRSFTWRSKVSLAAVLMVAMTLVFSPAGAELDVSPSTTFPTTVTLGDQGPPGPAGEPFVINVTNTSNPVGDPTDPTVPVSLETIGITPSCAAFFPGSSTCQTPEPGVFEIATGPGAATGTGGACAGTVFDVTGPDATGRYSVTPQTPVTLGPADGSGPQPTFCTVQLTLLEVDRVPTVDVAPATPGIQTGRSIDGTIRRIDNPLRTGQGSATQLVTVNPGTVTLDTVSTPRTGAGSPAPPNTVSTDRATVTRTDPAADPAPTGTVTFQLIQNPDATCSGPAFFGPVSAPVSAAGVADSPATPPLPAGTYNWVATYSGDANYQPIAAPVGCNDPDERFVIAIPPEIQVVKTADPLTRPEPGGDFTYTVVVTNPSTAVPLTITSLNDDVYGDLTTRPGSTCNTAPGTVLAPSPGPGNTYTCTFTAPFTGPPGSQLTDVVTATGQDQFGQQVSDTDDATVGITPVPPQVMVQKTADPLTRPEPGGDFTYTVVVTNTSTVEALTITSLTDSVYGDLTTRGTCTTAVGTNLAVSPGPGNTYTCSFTAPFTGQAGDALTDVVTVVGQDDDGQTATDSDDATVSLTGVPPQVTVEKTADPASRPEPGGDFTYTVVVTNTSTVEALTITSLTDSVYGDLTTRGTCTTAVGTNLAVSPGPGNTYTCSFTAPFTGVSGDTLTDVVTVVGQDDDGQTATDSDDATVRITGAPAIQVLKSADPTSRPEPGGDFTYTVVVTNTGAEPLTIDSLNDDVYGDLATRPGSTCGALIGTTLAPGASTAPCTFTAPFTGQGGDTLTDTVTVVGTSPAGTQVTDTDDAVVTLTPVPPVIDVDKTADPLTRPAPGGDFTFTVVVSNPGTVEPVTITSLNDDIYGDLATRPGSTCGALIGTTLAPGASSAPCTFTGPFTGPAGSSQTDIVTVTGVDDDGQTATASDDATVSIIAITPDISVDKRATPTTRPAPGGTFTFDVVVTNTGPNSLTITDLTDDIYGDLSTQGTCTTALGTVLPSGGSYSCSFQGDFTGIGGQSQTDIVTVTGEDANGTVVTDEDDATVTLTDVPPTVQVIKTANPLSRPEPGGEFTFTVVVNNTSNETVTITSLNDDIYGDLATRPGSTCGALVGTTLAANTSSAPCTFTGNFFGDAGATQTDVVTVVVTDAEGTTATDDDDAVVNITDIPPTIDVVKDADPTSMPAPGGTFTFTVTVTNTSFEPVTITSLTDDVYGNLNGRGTCAVGATLPANGGTYTCSFPGDFTGVPNAGQTDIVTVVAEDNDGTQVTDSDDATVTLTGGPVTITTVASAGRVGGEVFDTATLTGGFNPTGTVTFQLFGPDDEDCSGPAIFTSVNPVVESNGARTATSDRFILPAPGIYHWVATYSGDANNAPAGPTDCQDPNETVGVGRLPISLSTVASPSVAVGNGIFDTATLAGGFNPTGSITFRLYGPDNATCTGTPIFTSVKPVSGNASYTSDSFIPTQPGVYQWVAEYSGDANNAGAITPCEDPLERVTVTPVPVIDVDKTAAPTTLPAPGGTFTFNVVVTNPSSVALTIRTLTDDVYGDITQRPGSTCNTAIGTVLAPGGTYSCRFTGDFRSDVNASQTDVVTVTATDNQGNIVRANDDATVFITSGPPSITTTKTASPASLPEPGGTFTFTFTVVNNGPEPVTVTSLVDDVYGNLNGRGTCAVGARLAANGGSYTCTFTGNFFGNAGAAQTDTITTTAVDDQGRTVTSQSRATVTIFNVPPTVQVVKTPSPVSRPEPGGTFRFTVTVINTSFEPVTITSLVDDVYGNLNGRGSCAVGVVLAPNGGSYRCAFDGEFRGSAGASQTDIVTVTVVDNDGSTATAVAHATVTITPVTVPPVAPPPPPPPTPPAPLVPPTPPKVLVRTGSDFGGPARMAAMLVLVGMGLIVASRRFGGGSGLLPVPAGPGPGGGSGGPAGGGHWFGGTPPQPPRRPLGGPGAGFKPAPQAPTEPDDEPTWDEWVVARAPRPTLPAEPVEVAIVVPEPVAAVVVEVDDWYQVDDVVEADDRYEVDDAVEVEVEDRYEVDDDEVIVATVVPFRASGGLDAAALDAANATPVTPVAPPRRGRRRHGGH